MWGKEDLFWQHFALASSRAAFVGDDKTDVEDTETSDYNIDIVRTITMPPAFAQDSADFVTAFKQYKTDYPSLDYSVGNRDWVGHYADRESYFCYVAWLCGFKDYMNNVDEIVTTAPLPYGTSYTLTQILSYFLENNLLIAININTTADIALHSGDVVLCRTNAGITSKQLYGIGDMYVFDGSDNTFMKWSKTGLTRTLDIDKPAVVARPLLQKYGLYGMGRTQFESYINKKWSTLDNNNIVVRPIDDSLLKIQQESSQSYGASGTTGTITPAAGKKYIWFKLVEALDNEYAAAGIIGNLMNESNCQSNNLENTGNAALGMTDAEYTAAVDDGSYTNFVNDHYGYGLAQWTYYTRKQGLLNLAHSLGTSIGDLAMQVQWLITELRANTVLWSSLQSADCVRQASNDILYNFERPANPDAAQDKRAASSQAVYDEFHGTTLVEDTTLDAGQQPTGSDTVIADTAEAYRQSIVLQDNDGNNYPNINTLSWSTAGWAPKYNVTSGFGGRQGGYHQGIDLVPQNGNWNRYTIARCRVYAIRNSNEHWTPTANSWTYWKEEHSGTVVPSKDVTNSGGTYVWYSILDENNNEVALVKEFHFVYDSIPSNVTQGAILEAGTLIGVGGNTGKSTGRHIHFQINAGNANGKPLNPTPWLQALGVI